MLNILYNFTHWCWTFCAIFNIYVERFVQDHQVIAPAFVCDTVSLALLNFVFRWLFALKEVYDKKPLKVSVHLVDQLCELDSVALVLLSKSWVRNMAEIKKSLFISKHGRRNPFLSDRREGLQEHSRQRGGRDQPWIQIESFS